MIVEPTGLVMPGTCEIRSARCKALLYNAAITVVKLPDNTEVSVCRECFAKQIRDGTWEVPGSRLPRNRMSIEEATVVCLDRILTLGKGYITQKKDGDREEWRYGLPSTAGKKEYLKMNPEFAARLVQKGLIEQFGHEREMVIWKQSQKGHDWYEDIEL